jgi:hypothetical protein
MKIKPKSKLRGRRKATTYMSSNSQSRKQKATADEMQIPRKKIHAARGYDVAIQKSTCYGRKQEKEKKKRIWCKERGIVRIAGDDQSMSPWKIRECHDDGQVVCE